MDQRQHAEEREGDEENEVNFVVENVVVEGAHARDVLNHNCGTEVGDVAGDHGREERRRGPGEGQQGLDGSVAKELVHEENL